ncbi:MULTISPECIES: bifunctional metallophosphatase/5'-nucleotidase [Marinobacter]|uniref:5'-Nucleotidase domain-containing protein n=1 Tax=Marinobacter manganoxydans MnI7-9 TaxID=1094979 RepID=G6YU87_9GAMM|nr:bifunctional metallophosphatase/5'-nucleotidase [Marinobacter manganoxydans]EHJ04376.1 5'-Nucleotidase domain-containing protein [Marinobacter manganoxydans MnI7-9]
MRYLNSTKAGLIFLALGLTACTDTADESDVNALRDDLNNLTDQVNNEETFELQLLHLADMDGSNVDALANVGNIAAIVNGLRNQHPEKTLFVSSGDNYIPGSRYTASSDDSFSTVTGVATPGDGRADIAFLNAMGLEASAVGNHDLDSGTSAFAGLIAADGNWSGAQFPYLSANLDFSADTSVSGLEVSDGQEASAMPNSLAAYAVVTVDGEQIGLVGASTPTLENITSTGDINVLPANDSITDLAAEIQVSVNELTDSGVDKIILLAHMQQLAVEKQLASLLSEVDIIVGGGSNTLLADYNDRLLPGDTAADSYPLIYNSASNEPVVLVNVDGDYKYLGRLMVEFDAAGRIILSSINPLVSGVYSAEDETVSAVNGSANSTVDNIVTAVNDVLVAQESNILGNTSVYLNGQRSSVRSEETNLGNLTADANLWYAQEYDASVDISLKNGGGIRADIGSFAFPPGSTDVEDIEYFPPESFPAAGKETGDISQFDIQSALAFNNGLTLVDVSAAELKAIVEHGVSDIGGGRFPQVGGLSFSYDPGAAVGSRVTDLSVGGTAVVSSGVVQAAGPFRMVTLNFLAGGGDGYPIPATNREDLVLDASLSTSVDMSANDPGQASFAETGSEQDALAEYLKQFHPDDSAPFSNSDTIADDSATDSRISTL